ncbi:MAG: exodeoxyribonuclease VII small subunit [Gemmatimonadales bacterium]
MSETPRSFKDELENLERVVRSLEQEDVDLDDALKLFEEGVQRLKTARELLRESEATVKQIVEEADGTLSEENGAP